MWFKKKSVLQAEGHYNSNATVDGSDWRTTSKSLLTPSSETLPSAADAGNYFYLPALGQYYNGQLDRVGIYGYYWSSSAHLGSSVGAYILYFMNGNVYVTTGYRAVGFRVGGFE